jgi:hypothetical protein
MFVAASSAVTGSNATWHPFSRKIKQPLFQEVGEPAVKKELNRLVTLVQQIGDETSRNEAIEIVQRVLAIESSQSSEREQLRIRQLLEERTADSLALAFSLLESLADEPAYFNAVLTETVIGRLVGEGEIDDETLARWDQVLSASKGVPAAQAPLLDALEAALANHQSKGPGRTLTVNAATVSDDLAAALARHQGWLEFARLTELSDNAAAALATHASRLDLSSLTTLSDTAAEALWPHEGPLWLNGLRTLSDAAARSLAQHRGPLYLEGIETLSPAAAGSLAKHSGLIRVKRLRSLPDTPGHVAFAKKITQDKHLWLDGLQSLEASIAAALAKHRGMISLDGIETLSDAAVEALSEHKGKLYLQGLKDPKPESIKSLRRHNDVILRGYI